MTTDSGDEGNKDNAFDAMVYDWPCNQTSSSAPTLSARNRKHELSSEGTVFIPGLQWEEGGQQCLGQGCMKGRSAWNHMRTTLGRRRRVTPSAWESFTYIVSPRLSNHDFEGRQC